MTELQVVLLVQVLVLIAAVTGPLLVYVRLRAQQRSEAERLISRMEQNLGTSVKLLEVRNYHDQTAAELKKMLDEAYREGNRFRQDQLRRMMERLEALKVRTLDRTVKILEPEMGQPPRRRHRRGGRRGGFRPPGGQGRPQPPQGGGGAPPAPPRPPAPPTQA